jgi:hypothetical protein
VENRDGDWSGEGVLQFVEGGDLSRSQQRAQHIGAEREGLINVIISRATTKDPTLSKCSPDRCYFKEHVFGAELTVRERYEATNILNKNRSLLNIYC